MMPSIHTHEVKPAPHAAVCQGAGIATAEILTNLAAFNADLPEDAEVGRVEIKDLPPNWAGFPSPEPLQEIGARSVSEGTKLALSVPSAVIPQERNVFLNPAHPAFGRVRIRPFEPFLFDPRLLRAKSHRRSGVRCSIISDVNACWALSTIDVL